MFLAELREKHLVDDALFLVDSAPWLQAALHGHGLIYRYEKHGNRNAVERVFRELKRRTNQFSNCLATPKQTPSKIGFERSLSHGTS
jgi:transposase-like protein